MTVVRVRWTGLFRTRHTSGTISERIATPEYGTKVNRCDYRSLTIRNDKRATSRVPSWHTGARRGRQAPCTLPDGGKYPLGRRAFRVPVGAWHTSEAYSRQGDVCRSRRTSPYRTHIGIVKCLQRRGRRARVPLVSRSKNLIRSAPRAAGHPVPLLWQPANRGQGGTSALPGHRPQDGGIHHPRRGPLRRWITGY